MAFGDPYITRDELKTYLRQGTEVTNKIAPGVDNTLLDPVFDDAIATATDQIDTYCERQFNMDTEASPRVYTALSERMCITDDFHTTTDLVVKVDLDDDGVYETTLTEGTDYTLAPVNGIVNGKPGWPYSRIKLRENTSHYFPCGEQAVQVTARWGWAEIPKSVRTASFMIAHDVYKAKDSPFGVAGVSDFGVTRVRNNPLIERNLKPYRRRGGPDIIFIGSR